MNYYEILKVSQKATDAEIKSSYKALVKKYHPDLYEGDKNFAEQKIKEINEAYEVLSNPEKKAEYDEYLAPKPQYAPTSTQSYTKTASANYETPQPQWSFIGFIEKKFSKLEKNKQHQILVIIFFIALLLFLINIIQTQNYLKSQQTPSAPAEKPSENNYYLENKTIDELFYEMIIQSEKEFYDNYYNMSSQKNTVNP